MDSQNYEGWEFAQPSRDNGYGAAEEDSKFRKFRMTDGNQENHGNGRLAYQVCPYGWQPPSVAKQPSPMTAENSKSSNAMAEVDNSEMSTFVYIDPDNLETDRTEIPCSARPVAEAKKVCNQISKLLQDKDSRSRGSQMFQKRRKRAPKFTTIGYGTKPPEDDRYGGVPDDETSSEELSRLDYSSEDDKIPAYDIPSINNALQQSNLNPSQQIIKNQLKSLAMDVGSMRGKGAKIFAKRQQRMENYVITDENRRQVPQPSQYEDEEVARKEITAGRGPYVRPGSTIAITAKAQYKKQDSFSKLSSGYCTDLEDDYRSPYQPQLNYFSDCEYPVPELRGRSRRTRPSARRSWESDKQHPDTDPQNIPEDMQKHYDAPEESRPSIPPFRRVMPPGKSSYHSPAGHRSRDSSLSRITISPARDSRSESEDATASKRVWSRVAFNPRNPVPQQNPSQPVIGYPCTRTHNSPSRPRVSGGIKSQGPPQLQRTGKTTPATKPPMASFYQQKSQQKPIHGAPAIPTPTITNQRSVQNVLLKQIYATDKDARKSNYPTAVSVLEKPMEREATDNPDFVGEGEFIKQLSVGEGRFIAENLKDERNEGDQRPCSPASAASYVSSNSTTFTATLPSRCLTPPIRSHTPTGTPRVMKIALNGHSKPSSSLGSASTSSLAQSPSAVTSVKAPGHGYSNVTANSCSKSPGPTSIPISPLTNQSDAVHSFEARASAQNLKEDKVTACLKVLDPAKAFLPPKKPTQFMPSATLDAILQSENEISYGAMKTVPMSYEYPCRKVSDAACPPSVVMKSPSKQPVMQSQTLSTRSRSRSAALAPQPLGITAEGMKGKGAKMFEKQQKRMARYTKETSQEDFPELQSPRESSASDSPVFGGGFSYAPTTMAGISSSGEKLEPGNEIRNGMRDVVGEFQKTSKPGRPKRPSETKKKGRDPLYYQQQLFYQPPSAADFVEPPLEAYEAQSDTPSAASSKASSLSSFNADSKGDFISHQGQGDNYVTSLAAPVTSFGLDNRASASSSSISSQTSTGPGIAPKPSRELIQRHLPKSTSPVSTSSTPELQSFTLAPSSSEEISFSGVYKENSIEDLTEGIPDDRRNDDNITEDFDTEARKRTLSIDAGPAVLEDSSVNSNGDNTVPF